MSYRGVYSFKEMVEEDFEISFIECFGCSSIFYVGLRLFQGAVYGLPVIEAFGKIHYFGRTKISADSQVSLVEYLPVRCSG